MKHLYMKKTVKGTIVTVLMVLMTVVMLPVLFIKGPLGYSLLDYATEGEDVQLYAALSMCILMGVLALMALVTIPVVWVRGKGEMPSCITGIIVGIALLVLALSQSLLGIGNIIWLAVLIFLSLLGTVYSVIGLKYRTEEGESPEVMEKKLHFLPVLIINIISTLGLLMIFFIPVLTYQNSGVPENNVVLIRGLTGTSDPLTFACFLAGMVLMIVAGIFLFQTLTTFFYSDMRFVNNSKRSMYFTYIVAIAFFVAGVSSVFVYTLEGSESASTITYIPFAIYSVLMIVHCVLNGRNGAILDTRKKRKPFEGKYRFLLFVFITLFTAVTFITLKLPFLHVEYYDTAGNTVADTIRVSGYDLLKKAINTDLSAASFVMFSIVMVSGIIYVLSIMAFVTRNSEIKRFAYTAVVVNFMFVLVLGLFGKYYQISEKITASAIEQYVNSNYSALVGNVSLSDMYESKIGSECFLMIFVDTALAALMLIVKPISRCGEELEGEIALAGSDTPIQVAIASPEEAPATETEEEKSEDVPSGPEAEEMPEGEKKILPDFDACPAFTELDEMQSEFDAKMEERRTKLFENPTLPALTQFIVDYARESRLHLSYTPEDIATFIAGLGATKLSILQGMSGTGKTSLPKIFLEAVMGNCEIVEVESSWKDKNELLGYYNEFSKTFTPKKFTRALYKAALNPEVITFIVLDEMNLSRIEYYFSDFLSLMENEPENREIQLLNVKLYNTYGNEKHSYKALSRDHTLHIPENVWFIGTANRDESTFEISDKVYDRAHTMNFNKRAPKVRNFSAEMAQRYLPYEALVKMFDDALSASAFDLESVPYLKSLEEALRPYNISFGNRILNQIEAFVRIYSVCFNGSPEAVSDALEKILLSKVVAKLEFKTIEDKAELAHKFEKMNLLKCAEFINGLNEDL